MNKQLGWLRFVKEWNILSSKDYTHLALEKAFKRGFDIGRQEERQQLLTLIEIYFKNKIIAQKQRGFKNKPAPDRPQFVVNGKQRYFRIVINNLREVERELKSSLKERKE